MEDRGLGRAGTANMNNGEWEGRGHTRREKATRGKVKWERKPKRAKSRVVGTLGQSTTEVEQKRGLHVAEERTPPLGWERELEGGCGLTS